MALLFPGREQAILPLRKLTTVNLNYACEEDYKQLMSFLINWKSFKKLNTQILKLTPINSVEKDTVVERDNFFLSNRLIKTIIKLHRKKNSIIISSQRIFWTCQGFQWNLSRSEA